MHAGRGGGAPGPGAPLLRDYWLDEPHGPCAGGCGFMLHGFFGLYMADPVHGGQATELDRVIAQMFEARFTASFVLDDLCEFYAAPDVDLNHYKVKAAAQRMPIELSRFREMINRFRGGLSREQGSAMAPLDPVAKKIFSLEEATKDLRNPAAHLGSGLHGIASMAGSTGGAEPELEDKIIKSAHLIAMYVDCAMHQFPGCFRRALSKAAVGDLDAALPDPRFLPDSISAFKRENPIATMRLDRIGDKETPLMSELLKIRNALQVVPAAHVHLCRFSLGSGKMPRLWTLVQHRKLAYYMQYATLETINFFDLYAKIKEAGLVGDDDGIIKLLARHEPEIREMRQLVAHWESGRDFTTAVNAGIGHQRLFLVAALVGEWARLNGNEYTERCGLDRIPWPDQIDRRLALGRIEHEVGIMREEARSRGAGTLGQDCPP